MIVPAALAAIAVSAGATAECPDLAGYRAALVQYLGEMNHQALFVFAERRIIFSPNVCGTLGSVVSGRRPSGELAAASAGFAVYTFAHELAHADGITDEAAADCQAARTFIPVVEQLGASRRDAVRMLEASALIDGYDPSVFIGCAPALARNAV